MIPDQFQLELQNLLRKYNKEIKVSIQPIIVDAPREQMGMSTEDFEEQRLRNEVSHEVVKKVLKGKKK